MLTDFGRGMYSICDLHQLGFHANEQCPYCIEVEKRTIYDQWEPSVDQIQTVHKVMKCEKHNITFIEGLFECWLCKNAEKGDENIEKKKQLIKEMLEFDEANKNLGYAIWVGQNET